MLLNDYKMTLSCCHAYTHYNKLKFIKLHTHKERERERERNQPDEKNFEMERLGWSYKKYILILS